VTISHEGLPPLGLLVQHFYRPDALPVTQPTASKHWRKNWQSVIWRKSNVFRIQIRDMIHIQVMDLDYFFKNSSTTLWVILHTHKQTDRQTDMTRSCNLLGRGGNVHQECPLRLTLNDLIGGGISSPSVKMWRRLRTRWCRVSGICRICWGAFHLDTHSEN